MGFGLGMISRIFQTSVNIYYREQQETAERNASRRGQHFDKLKQAEIPDMKG